MTRFVIRPAGFGGLLKLQALPLPFARMLTYIRNGDGKPFEPEPRFIAWRHDRNSRQRAAMVEHEGQAYVQSHQAELHEAVGVLSPVTRECPFGDDHTTEHIDGEPPHHKGPTLQ